MYMCGCLQYEVAQNQFFRKLSNSIERYLMTWVIFRVHVFLNLMWNLFLEASYVIFTSSSPSEQIIESTNSYILFIYIINFKLRLINFVYFFWDSRYK